MPGDIIVPLRTTPLTELHRSLGAKLVPFAGYEMPVQFADGILKEHLHTRAAAGLFDVSHMGQVTLRGAAAAAALERLVPGDLQALRPGRMRYTMLPSASCRRTTGRCWRCRVPRRPARCSVIRQPGFPISGS